MEKVNSTHIDHKHIQAKFDSVEAKVKKAFAAIKEDIKRIEHSKRPEMTVTPVDYKLRTDFMAFRNSILQEIDFIKESVMSIKQYGPSNIQDLGSADDDRAAEEIAELREDIKELAEVVVKKQKRYEQELRELQERFDAIPTKKK